MKGVCWLVFLAFIGLSSFANWEHGTTRISAFMLAVVPVGFAASIFILEGIVSAGKATKWSYAGIIFVAAAAGIASYLGLYGMARESDIPLVQSALLPLAFDGVVAVASMGIRAFSVIHPATENAPEYGITQPIEPDVDWNAELASIEDMPEAPVSPAPVLQHEEPSAPRVPRAPRASWDARLVAEMILDGAKTPEITDATGAKRASIDRLRAGAKLLQANPRAEVPASMKISADNVKMLRELVLR